MPASLREITILCDEANAEAFGDLLFNAGVLSVTTEDADADSTDEKPIFGEPGVEPQAMAWTRSRLSLLVDDDFDAVAAIAQAAEDLQIETPTIESDTAVPEKDWVKLTQAQFAPTKVSDRLWIVPSWHVPPNPDAINIRLDPGVAFGTGSHPTTHLCLNWLDENVSSNDRVLDYGCGTGILAISAAKLGAGSVTGTDIDPQAVEAAQRNAKDNDVTATFVLPDDLAAGTYDVVVANILANPIKFLAPALLARVGQNGRLVLSGILSRQAEEVLAVYKQHDPSMKLSVWAENNGWVCITGSRQGD